MNIGVNTRFLLPGRHLEGIGRYTYEVMSRMVEAHPEHRFYFYLIVLQIHRINSRKM
ncbi:MAG: hypothetical protein IPN29_16835 [Saprospiraceae bacterium]|nr:hypothetical protein [Saprospiraceae bacterium]